jgi:hypothetical protein
MTMKDFVYLGLIALSAVVFYLHGFQAGAQRTRKIFSKLFKATEAMTPLPPPEPKPPLPSPEWLLSRGHGGYLGYAAIRGEFGNN